MKRVLKLIAASALLASTANADDITVDSPIITDTIWTADNEYTLSGFIFVKDDAILTIEPGTVIRANAGTGPSASALIVTRGSKIYALGTASDPIVFTAAADPMDGTWTADQGGAWGGVVILGNAPINSNGGVGSAPGLEDVVEGIPGAFGDDRLFGGDVADDNSGIFRYVSIRFGGSALGPDNEINGLTLGGVGSSTIIEFVEVFGNADDGVEFFGGTVNTRYMAVGYQGDDGFDYDQGYVGKGQFWFNVADARVNLGNESFEPDNGAEMDGETASQGGVIGGATVLNATFIGAGDGAGRALRTRDNAFSKYFNSIFTGWEDEAVRIDGDSADRIAPGDDATKIELAYNIFDATSFAGTTADELSHGDEGSGDDEAYLFAASFNNSVVDPLLRSVDRGTFVETDAVTGAGYVEPNGMLDPRPQAVSPAFTDDLMAIPAGDTFFAEVDYQGAFGEVNWLNGWTYLSQAGYLPESNERSDGGILATAVRTDLDVAAGEVRAVGLIVTGELPRLAMIHAESEALATGASSNAFRIYDYGAGSYMKDKDGNDMVWADWETSSQKNAIESMFKVYDRGDLTGDDSAAITLLSLQPGAYSVDVYNPDGTGGESVIAVTFVD